MFSIPQIIIDIFSIRQQLVKNSALAKAGLLSLMSFIIVACGLEVEIESSLVPAATCTTGQRVPQVFDYSLIKEQDSDASLNARTINYDQPDSASASVYDPLLRYQWYLHNNGQEIDFLSYSDPKLTPVKTVSGNDIQVKGVHNDRLIRGKGVVINVVDDGLEAKHEDLRVDVANSYNYYTDKHDPSPPLYYQPDEANCDSHGTSVAGVAAAKSGNEVGGVGVAPGATIIGHSIPQLMSDVPTVDGGRNNNEILESALGVNAEGAKKSDIINMSWGLDDVIVDYNRKVNKTFERILKEGVFEGRKKGDKSPLGYAYVKSAGNSYYTVSGLHGYCSLRGLPCDNSSIDITNPWPNIIVVSSSNDEGKFASYTTVGSSVFVNAPSGERAYYNKYQLQEAYFTQIEEKFGEKLKFLPEAKERIKKSLNMPATITTDLMGCRWGYSMEPSDSQIKSQTNSSSMQVLINNPFEYDFNAETKHPKNQNCNYTSIFNGTSAAAPIVSGVIALMLEKQPQLSWRDLRTILATTSDRIDGNIDDLDIKLDTKYGTYIFDRKWLINGAGRNFSNFYGFGRVNAEKAIAEIDQKYQTAPLLPAELFDPDEDSLYGKKFIINDVTMSKNTQLDDASGNTIFPHMIETSTADFNNWRGGEPSHKKWAARYKYEYQPTPGSTNHGITSLESVKVRLSLAMRNLGTLFIRLTSPSGTKSTLLTPYGRWNFDTNGKNKKLVIDGDGSHFLSNAFYGENPAFNDGFWYLELFDADGTKDTKDLPKLTEAKLEFTGHNK